MTQATIWRLAQRYNDMFTRLLILLYAMLGISTNASAVLLGVEINKDGIYRIDPTTAQLNQVGTVGDTVVAGLAWDTALNILYGSSTATDNLLTINPWTGETQVLGSFGQTNVTMHNIEVDTRTGNLYGYSADSFGSTFYQIDKATGVLTFIGTTNLMYATLAYDYMNNIMYSVDNNGFADVNDGLYAVDLLTGHTTLVGYLNNSVIEQIADITYHPNYGLIGVDNRHGGESTNKLFNIDPLTGQATLIGDLDPNLGHNSNFLAVAFVSAIPIPPAMWMFASGLIILFGLLNPRFR